MSTTAVGTVADTHTDADPTRRRIARQFPGLDVADVPRRFLLIEYTDDSVDGAPRIYAWGLALTDFAIVFQPGGMTARLSSAERALWLFGHSCDDIAWLDPESDGEPDGPAGGPGDPDQGPGGVAFASAALHGAALEEAAEVSTAEVAATADGSAEKGGAEIALYAGLPPRRSGRSGQPAPGDRR
ncbi:MAG: hypothetical protein WCA46_29805 [Actinocatenispora sp.]